MIPNAGCITQDHDNVYFIRRIPQPPTVMLSFFLLPLAGLPACLLFQPGHDVLHRLVLCACIRQIRQIVCVRACATCTCCMRVCVGVCAKPPRTCFSVCRWHCRVACRPVQPWRQLATAPGDAASPPSTLQPPQHTAISEAVCVFLSFSVTCSLACALCLCLCLPSSLCFYLSVACRFYFGVCLYPCVSMSTPECSS